MSGTVTTGRTGTWSTLSLKVTFSLNPESDIQSESWQTTIKTGSDAPSRVEVRNAALPYFSGTSQPVEWCAGPSFMAGTELVTWMVLPCRMGVCFVWDTSRPWTQPVLQRTIKSQCGSEFGKRESLHRDQVIIIIIVIIIMFFLTKCIQQQGRDNKRYNYKTTITHCVPWVSYDQKVLRQP